MNETVYSATLLQILVVPLVGALAAFLLAFLGFHKMRRENKPHLDLPFAAAIGIVVVFGAYWLGSTIYSVTQGSQTISARLTDKKDVISTNSRGGNAHAYQLYFGPRNVYQVPDSSILDKMTPGECYQVTAYQDLSPFALLSQSDTGIQKTRLVAEIRLAPTQQCP